MYHFKPKKTKKIIGKKIPDVAFDAEMYKIMSVHCTTVLVINEIKRNIFCRQFYEADRLQNYVDNKLNAYER